MFKDHGDVTCFVLGSPFLVGYWLSLHCPFWKKKIYFKDVVKISVVYLGGYAVPYMRIIIDKKRACRYYINRVKRKQLPELVDSLRKKGIDEDARGMDMLK